MQFKNNCKTQPKTKRITEFIISVCIGLAVAIVLKNFVFINAVVPSESMEPTVMTNDKLIGNRLAYLRSDPQRGDIITFDSPVEPNTTYLKRIIGLPGETLTIVGGKVYVNDNKQPLSEPYINSLELDEKDYGPFVIPDDCYFVMGDNRNNSHDSRHWETTHFISKESISSKIMFRYSPDFKKIK